MGVGGCHAPSAFTPGKDPYPLYWKLSRPQGRSGWVRKISPLPGIDPRTLQTVAGRYIDSATPGNLGFFTIQNPNMHIWCEIFSWTAWPLKMEPIDCPEALVTNYERMPRNIPEKRRSLPILLYLIWFYAFIYFFEGALMAILLLVYLFFNNWLRLFNGLVNGSH